MKLIYEYLVSDFGSTDRDTNFPGVAHLDPDYSLRRHHTEVAAVARTK